MRVIHVLKDGSVVDDISGHVVRVEDAETLYRMIRKINAKSERNKIRELSAFESGSNKKYLEVN